MKGQKIKNQTATEPSVTEEREQVQASGEIETLRAENQTLKEKAARALADYQNLVRRQQEEQSKMVEFARVSIFESLLQPLEHLALAAQAVQDEGLALVVKQFWQTLKAQGLEEFSPQGEKFDPLTMEVLEKSGDGEKVRVVLAPGYKLNGTVLKVARVKVG